MPPRSTCILFLALSVLGCAGRKSADLTPRRSGTAELEVLPPPEFPPPPPGYKPSSLSPQIPPETIERPLPSYPDSALADEVACTARLLYHVETNGSARLVRLEWDLRPPEGHVASFESAIRDAVARWEFVPAVRFTRKEQPGKPTRYEKHVIPKAGRVLIRFRIADGKAVVE